jgi:hypothetical protein
MNLRPSSLGPFLAAILVTMLVGGAGYSAWWWHLSGEVRVAIEAFAAERRAAGWVARWSDLTVSGFPGPLKVRFDKPVLYATNGVGWEGAALEGWIRPWDLTRAEISAPGRHLVNYGGKPFALETDEVRGAVWASNGRLTGGEASLVGVAANGDLHARRVFLRVEKSGDWLARGQVEQFDFPPESRPVLGRRIETGAFQARVKGPIAGIDPVGLAVWRDEGGKVEIERLDAAWGPLGVALSGTAALDAGLQPAGSFSGKVQGHDETLDALARAGLVDQTVANISKIALGLFAWRAEGRPTLELPISVKDRQLSVGPVRLARLPAIDWSRN